jgi:hypothetical protein
MSLSLSGDGVVTGLDSLASSDLGTQLGSKLDIPGVWTAYTPTVTSETGSLTTVTAGGAFTQLGKLVVMRFDVDIANAGTGGGILRVSLPANGAVALQYGGFGTEYQATGVTLNVGINQPVSVSVLEIKRFDNASVIATNRRCVGVFIYQAA